jgi:hypothetical protein
MPDEPQEPEPTPETEVVQPLGMDPRTGRPFEPIEVPVRKQAGPSLWDKMMKWARGTRSDR